MKKNNKTITIIIAVVLIIGGYYLFKKIKSDAIKSSYDYIVVGTSCSTEMFGTYKQTFGIKNGSVDEISNSFSKDMSNINRIVRSDDMITYFSYDTWYNMYEKLGYVDYCSICTEDYNRTVKEAHDNYDYNEKDLTIFNKILDILDEKEKNSMIYFIVTDKNYYIFSYEGNNKIFKYNEENNSLDLLLDLKLCTNIEFFYEK